MTSAEAAIERTLQAIIADITPIAHVMSGKTTVISGAGGFVGRWLCLTIARLNRDVLPTPCRVIAVDAMASTGAAATAELRQNADFINSDLSSPLGISERIDFAMHAAGIASPYWYMRRPLETISAAVDGSRNVLSLLEQPQNKGSRYLFFSTSELYQTPPPEQVPTPETYIGAIPTMGDRSCYDQSKALGETLAHVYAGRGLDTGVIRIFNSFGPFMSERDHRILPRIASAIVGGRPVRVYADDGRPAPTRTYCPVASTIAGCFRVLLRGLPGEAYNIGASSPEIDVRGLIGRIEAVTGRPVAIDVVKPPAVYVDEPRRRCPDIRKAQRDLGYREIVGLNAGLEAFFDWALDTFDGREA